MNEIDLHAYMRGGKKNWTQSEKREKNLVKKKIWITKKKKDEK